MRVLGFNIAVVLIMWSCTKTPPEPVVDQTPYSLEYGALSTPDIRQRILGSLPYLSRGLLPGRSGRPRS